MEILSTSDTLTLVLGREDHCYLLKGNTHTYFLIAALFPWVCDLIGWPGPHSKQLTLHPNLAEERNFHTICTGGDGGVQSFQKNGMAGIQHYLGQGRTVSKH